MPNSFRINGGYQINTLEQLNGITFYLFQKNQNNLIYQKFIKIVLDGDQKSLIRKIIENFQIHLDSLINKFTKNEPEQINLYKDQIAQEFYQYLSSVEIQLNKSKKNTFKFTLKMNQDIQQQYLEYNEYPKIAVIMYDILQQIYQQRYDILFNSNHIMQSKLVEFFREVLIIKFKGYKVDYRKQKQLILQQNGDIIISKFNNQQTFAFSKSKTFHSQYPRFCQQKLLKDQSLKQIVSEGMLDDNFDSIGYTTVFSSGNLIYKGFLNFGLLNGEGIIQNIQNEILYQGSFIHNQKHGDGIITLNQQNYQGCFRKDYMDGIFRIQNDLNQQILYFCRDIQVEKQNFEKSNNYTIQSDKGLQIIQKNSQNNDVTLSISQYLNFEISIFSYKALSPGQWLFETQVDYFLAYFLNYFAMFSKLEQTIIFNTNESSDYICCDENQEFQINEMLYQKLDQSKKDKKRKVFVMNSQRSHFMIMIEDNKKLYCCDSLYKVNKNLENAFYNLLKIQDRNCYALKCTQQKNGYDCGIYSLYYAIQFMKYDNLSMVDLEMKLCLRNPSQFRWNLKQLVKQNHDYLLTNI